MTAPVVERELATLRPALRESVEAALDGGRPTRAQALALAEATGAEHPALWAAAAALRDRGRPGDRHLLAQGLHPADQPLPRRLLLLHLRPR